MEKILVIISLAVVFFAIFLYNRLVQLRQNNKQAFADIDVQLKQRYDLIPALVNVVKGYAIHEKELLSSIAVARSQAINAGNIAERMNAENNISTGLGALFAVVENYPDLKANQSFARLVEEISDIENKIAAARRFFNSAVSEYNSVIQQFPTVLVAILFKFKPEIFFEISNKDERKTVEVKF